MGDAQDREDELSDIDVVENDDLDRESLFSEDLLLESQSPVDGYFEARDHPQDTFVQNSSVQAEAEAKAREAAREQAPRAPPTANSTGSLNAQTNYQPPSVQSLDGQRSHSTPAWQSASTPQAEAGPPPPDYLTAISDSSSSGRASQAAPSPPQSHASTSQSNYGTMNAPETNLPWPLGSQGNPFAAGNDNPWPFGSKGNPFAGGNDNAWPFGNRGNPFANPNFPFGSGQTFWNPQGVNSQGQTQGNTAYNNPQSASDQYGSQAPSEVPYDYANSQDSYTDGQTTASFGQDHPLVRNGLFSDAGVFSNASQPQSMSDRPPQHPPTADSHRAPAAFDDGESFDQESALIGLEGPRDPRSGRGIWRRSRWSSNKAGGWRSRVNKGRRWVSSCCYRTCWILGFIVLAVVIAIIVLTRHAGSSPNDAPHTSPSHNHTSPNPPTGVPVASSPFDPPENNNYCQWGERQRLVLKRNTPRKLTLIESLRRPRTGGPNQISGEIKIGTGDSDQEEDVKISIYMQASKGWSVESINYDDVEGGIELQFPDLAPLSDSQWRDCLWLGVHIQVRPELSIEEFEVNTAHLRVSSDEELFGSIDGVRRRAQGLRIGASSTITTTAGSIRLPYWNSRETRIRSNAGQVHGQYALLDLLAIETSSGNVNIDVAPKEVDSDRPKPAELYVETHAGSVDVSMPTSGEIPARDYKTTVSSSSGSIQGSLLFESAAKISSHAGSVNVEVLPYTNKAESLRTSTSSSITRLELLSPFTAFSSGSSLELAHLSSSHESVAGGLEIRYPQEWTGDIRADSVVGSIKLRGKDLQSTTGNALGSSWKKSARARKGNGDSHAVLSTTAGSIDMTAGDPE